MSTSIEITDDLRIAIVDDGRREEIQLDRESALRVGLALIGIAAEPPVDHEEKELA